MQLIGMLDSPYVRRVAIALMRLGLPFEHRPVSLFRHIEEFSRYNPMLKAPTLVTDEGVALMDSTLIIDHLVTLAPAAEPLMPAGADRLAATRTLGLSLLVCEKAVQVHYERALRAPEKQHEPWLQRILAQLFGALDALEAEVDGCGGRLYEHRLTLPDITLACAFGFTQGMLADLVRPERTPAIAAFCAALEDLPEFLAAPPLDGVQAKAPR